jgi:hypothetical protein
MRARFQSILLAVGLAAVVAGCSDLGNPVRPVPRPELSVTALDFGTVALSASSTRNVTVTNSGTARLTGVASVSCPGYELIAGSGGFTIPPGGSVGFVVRFSPSGVGSFPCTLDLGAECPKVALQGSGAIQAPGAACVVLPDSVDLGFAAVGGATTTGAFQIFSVGTAPLLVDVVSSNGDFGFVSGGGSGEVPPGGVRNVIVQFHPQGGRRRFGTIAAGPGLPEVRVKGVGMTISLHDDIRPILAARCAESCHFHGFNDPTNGDLYLSYYVAPFDTTNSWIYWAIASGYMPQGGPPLEQDQIATFRDWIMEGAKAN